MNIINRIIAAGISKILGGVLIGLLSLYSDYGWASDTSQTDEEKLKHHMFGVGVGYMRFDTNIKFVDKDSGLRLFIDGEGTLGLPESHTVPLFYGHIRFSKRHGLGFSYFRINRHATLFQLDEKKDFHLGDLTITAGAQANVSLTDETKFYYMSYNYTIFDDDRSFLFASFGLYGLDLLYRFDASGSITLNDFEVVGDSYSEEASAFAPLPMFGLDAWFFFTPKWAIGTKISLVGGSYQEISGGLIDTSVRWRYKINKMLGATFGITYVNAGLTIDDEDLKTEVAYGFDGIALGFDFRF